MVLRTLGWLTLGLLRLVAASHGAHSEAATQYEYIVVGSGAGGGTLASRLAREGHSTLLIEAGDDQSSNDNTTIPLFQSLVTGDPEIQWDFFVNHYQDQSRAARDPKYTKGKGCLYPRAQIVGGCVTHNALIFIRAHDSDWDGIARITGDSSWSARNMDKYLDKVYEWQPVNPTDPSILVRDTQLVRHLVAGAAVLSPSLFRSIIPQGLSSLLGLDRLNPIVGISNALLGDANARTRNRDSTTGLYPIPLTAEGGARKSIREHIKDTIAQGYPLTLKTNTFVTKVLFDESGDQLRACGVEYLEGKHLYRASPKSGGKGTPGSVRATKEVILAGGTFNTVQLLKLSGIGPKKELESFKIPVKVNLPGVGRNMQDRYEIGLNVQHEKDFSITDGCRLDAKPHDKCYKQWKQNPNILAQRGAYASNGLAATMIGHSDYADNSDVDLWMFSSPSNFRGYFPQWYDTLLAQHNWFSWYTLKAHTRNTAGTVKLRSADPLDVPQIDFNYFDTGTTANGAADKDLASMVKALRTCRKALAKYNDDVIARLLPGSKFVEKEPGPHVQSDEDLGQYIKDRAWGHHACGTTKIGADGDKMAVLDSKFRVRGVKALRIADAGVFPKIPGVFITAPIFVMAEKAADTILHGGD
ncbi:unnamed protein product [Zymoseptoria tritici ST99CH_3D7]|uniref:Glucose-methanol-choline oxidoreductase N-terminal domain-containing protein n=2 Tax=Zymoseptoria tritici TaxID=1047171 RepID=A0A1X7RP65_ZYMT9|nr:unnamed protein product [Zymoseptoria tritici ST99CH_3D7]SMR49022.1 unnamed protein product [Zymoseptoria tritici ST99CH_1E4]